MTKYAFLVVLSTWRSTNDFKLFIIRMHIDEPIVKGFHTSQATNKVIATNILYSCNNVIAKTSFEFREAKF